MTFAEWERRIPAEIAEDSLWKMRAYRLARFASDIGWHDASRLVADRRTRATAGQLYRALGSICANISEGYSRRSGRDKARLYEYALGSARESRDWYWGARHILGDNIVAHRHRVLAEVIRLLLVQIVQQRKSVPRL